MIYDFQNRQWRDAAHGIFGFNSWSRNGKSIYLVDMTGEGEEDYEEIMSQIFPWLDESEDESEDEDEDEATS